MPGYAARNGHGRGFQPGRDRSRQQVAVQPRGTEQPNCFVELDQILSKVERTSMSGRSLVTPETTQERRRVLRLCFRELHSGGFVNLMPRGLKPRHIQFLVDSWNEKGLAAPTIKSRLSFLSLLCQAIGKPEIVQSFSAQLVKDRKTKAPAKAEKSTPPEVAEKIDLKPIIEKIAAEDRYAAIQLDLMFAFGLSRKEAVLFKPLAVDRGSFIDLTIIGTSQTKSPRKVLIDNAYQRDVLDRAKALARENGGRVTNPSRKFQQSLNKLSNVPRKYGISKSALGVTMRELKQAGKGA